VKVWNVFVVHESDGAWSVGERGGLAENEDHDSEHVLRNVFAEGGDLAGGRGDRAA
jgi:hypothetical protein